MSGAVRVIASAILYSVIARLMPYTVIARADRLVAIPSQSTIDNVDSMIVIARRALPDVAISSQCFVMLSNAKHLEVCTTIHRLRDLEILHFVQNDVVSVYVIARRALPDVSISSQSTIDNVDSVLPLRRFLDKLGMTLLLSLRNRRDQRDQNEASVNR